MGKIYENAYLTIAASLAPSDTEGFLRPRTKYISKGLAVAHLSFPGGSAKLKIRLAMGKHLRHDVPGRIRDSWRTNLIGPAGPMQPLDYRAWCFQEKLVSRRLLSYCQNEIEWDCVDCCDCECGERYRVFFVDGWDWRNASARQVFQGLISVFKNSPMEQKSKVREAIFRNWRMSLVPTYTQLSLTKEMDRLPALSAIAKTLEAVLDDRYLAGHWKSDHLGLCWVSGAYGTNPPSPGRLPGTFRAPSWSWASIEGPVDFCYDYEDDYVPIYEIVDAGVTTVGESHRVSVGDVFVKVSGYLILGRLSISNLTGHVETTNGQKKTIYDISFDGNYTESLGSFCPDTPLASDGDTFCRNPLLDNDRHMLDLSGSVQCLAILIARVRKNTGFTDRSSRAILDFSADRVITFLVLSQRYSTSQAVKYERLGILRSVHVSKLPDKWDEKWPKQEVTII
jgi:hypothetical protein